MSKTAFGYPHPLFILPFDQRKSFKALAGVSDPVNEADLRKLEFLKMTIFQGFQKAVEEGSVPKDHAAILVDEELGARVARAAHEKGFQFAMPVEKSGAETIELTYGDAFAAHVESFEPDFVKGLVNYNPADDSEREKTQLACLKKVSDYCIRTNRLFLLEPLIPPTATQDTPDYDSAVRPKLAVKLIEEFQVAGVEPDIWKIEGCEHSSDYERIVAQVRAGDSRKDVGIIILGRASTDERVRAWLRAGARVKGVIGFAIGRTIFAEPIKLLAEQKITESEAVNRIAEKYVSFYRFFVSEQGRQ